jgi:hypothetical protein
MFLFLPLGTIVVTDGARSVATADEIVKLLHRHRACDFGVLDAHDTYANEHAVRTGTRVISNYVMASGKKIWIITEADRSATTVLLPEEY